MSTPDQNLDLQTDGLRKAGCEKICSDKISGAKAERPWLGKALELSRAGDTLVIWRLDRLGRSLKDLISISETLKERSIGLKSLEEGIDTTSNGILMFNLMSVLAEFERNLILERSKAGLEAARARGKVGGRPKMLDPKEQQLVVKLYHNRQHSIGKICSMMSISKPTLYKYIQRHKTYLAPVSS